MVPRHGRTVLRPFGGMGVRGAVGLEHVVDELGGVGRIGETAQHPDVRDEDGRVQQFAAGANEFVQGNLALGRSRSGGGARMMRSIETRGNEEGREGGGEVEVTACLGIGGGKEGGKL